MQLSRVSEGTVIVMFVMIQSMVRPIAVCIIYRPGFQFDISLCDFASVSMCPIWSVCICV